jgi:hypothetical protein
MMHPIAVVWLSLMVLVGNIERQQLARTLVAASALKVGQSESDVASRLGRPLEEYDAYAGWSFFAIGKHPRQWCYGTNIDLGHVFVVSPIPFVHPLPIHVRWFGYCEEDLVLEFDDAGRMTRVVLPELQYEVDARYDGTVEALRTLHEVWQVLSKR